MAAGVGMAVNIVLAIVKIVTGVVGNSYALIADGIESTSDIVSSLVVLTGLKISSLPADEDHPYGHGKAESIAGMVVALALLAAAVFIAVQSLREIITPHHVPAWYTLLVLALAAWAFGAFRGVGAGSPSCQTRFVVGCRRGPKVRTTLRHSRQLCDCVQKLAAKEQRPAEADCRRSGPLREYHQLVGTGQTVPHRTAL
jgi:hypothetical protein